MAQYDDLDAPRIATIGIISVVVTAVTALAVQVMFYALAEWQDAAKSAQSEYRRENQVLSQQTQKISQYGVDETTGRVTIPINQAMELIVSESPHSQADVSNQSSNDET